MNRLENGHLSNQELLGFVTHYLSEYEDKAVKKHIAYCKECLHRMVTIYKRVKEVCNRVILKFPAYIEGELSEEDKDMVKFHIHACSWCLREFATFIEERALSGTLPQVPLPKEFPTFADALRRHRKRIVSAVVEKAIEKKEKSFLISIGELNGFYQRIDFLSEVALGLGRKGMGIYSLPANRSPILDLDTLTKREEPFILIDDAPRFSNLEYLLEEVKKPVIATGSYIEWANSEITTTPKKDFFLLEPPKGKEIIETEKEVESDYKEYSQEEFWKGFIYLCSLGRFNLPISAHLLVRLLGRTEADSGWIIKEGEKKGLFRRVNEDSTLLLPKNAYTAEKVLEIEFADRKDEEIERMYKELIQNASQEDASYLAKLLYTLTLRSNKKQVIRIIEDEACQKSLISSFTNLDERFTLARVYTNINRFDKAEIFFKDALKIAPENKYLLHSYAKMLGKARHYDKAKETFENLKEVSPESIYIYHALGDMEAKRVWRHWKKAIAYFEEALNIDNKNIYSLVSLGNLEVKRNEFKSGEGLFQEALRIDPENLYVLNSLGEMEKKRLNYIEADEYFQKVLAIDPYNIPTINAIGNMEKERGWLNKAEAHFREALKIDPENIHSLHSLAEIMVEKESYEDTERLFKEILLLDPSNLHTYIAYAVMKAKREEFSEAEKLLEKANEIDEENPYVYNAWANMYSRQGKYEEAEDFFEEALKITEDNERESVPIYNCRAKMWARRKEFDKARKDIERSLKAFVIAKEREEIEETILELSRIITLNTAADIESEAGDFTKAEEYFKEALSLDKENAYTHFSYAKMLIKTEGREEEVRRHLEKAKELGLQTPEVLKIIK